MIRLLLPLTVILLMILTVTCGNNATVGDKRGEIPRDELKHLDAIIANCENYSKAVRRPIDSLVAIASRPGTDSETAADLYIYAAHELSVLNADSALELSNAAIRHAAETGNDSIMTSAEIARLSALTSAGIFNLAEEELLSIGSKPMPKFLKNIFWQVARQLYANMHLYTIDNFELASKFRSQAMAYDDSLIATLPESHNFRTFLICERLVTSGDYRRARSSLQTLIPQIKDSIHLMAMAAYQMAVVEKNCGNEYGYAQWMARAAGNDIRSGVRDGLALFSLANWLYERGEITPAFHYINFAMREAMAGDARMRAVNIASMLPMIDETYRQVNKKSHERMSVFISICAGLLVILGTFLFMLVWQRKHYIKTERKLKALSRTQETHLANFLSLCSSYMLKLNSLEMLVQRKIASGQTSELLKIMKSGKYSNGDPDSIFKIFDRYFLEIYPDFIEKINSLLRPEERYQPLEKGLHHELRIYALVCMGITESSKIALILNYSSNTVYAYRNKVRNKAINRDTFEADVANISPVDKL